MYLFDLHCDTITRLNTGERLRPGDRSLCHNGAHIALDRMERLGWCQCFAIFIPDEYRGGSAIDYFEDNYRFFREQMAENAGRVMQVRSVEEIEQAIGCGKCAALLTVEGGAALAGDLGRVKRLADCGVKILTLTWNGTNELASGKETDSGFTAFGREAVPALERAGILLDVSHLNDRGFWELTGLATRPFIATHSNSRAVCNVPRNLTDEQFCRIVKGGGIVGLNFCVHFISKDPDPTFEQLAAHISHFLELGGEDALALGSDYDGTDVPSWLDPAEKVRSFYQMVCAAFGEKLADKIFYRNALEFFRRYGQLYTNHQCADW